MSASVLVQFVGEVAEGGAGVGAELGTDGAGDALGGRAWARSSGVRVAGERVSVAVVASAARLRARRI